jgi:hypothetical protein
MGYGGTILIPRSPHGQYEIRTSIYLGPQSVRKLGYGMDDRGSIPGRGNDGKFYFFATESRPALGPTQPSVQWEPVALSPRVEPPGREAD